MDAGFGCPQVSQKEILRTGWCRPIVPGMGGAMDLVVGARRVIIATTHTKKGEAKIVKVHPALTAKGVVKLIVTEYAVFSIEKGIEVDGDRSRNGLDEIRAITVILPWLILITMQGTEEKA